MDVRRPGGRVVTQRIQRPVPRPVARAAPALHKLLVLEDRQLLSLSGRPEILQQFPFFRQLQQANRTKKASCGCGGRKSDPAVLALYASVKQALAGMTADNKQRFKQLVKAQAVQVKFMDGKTLRRETF